MFARVLMIIGITTGLAVLAVGSASAIGLLLPAVQKVREAAARHEQALASQHGPRAVATARSHGVVLPAPSKKLLSRKRGRMRDGTSNTLLLSERRTANSLRQLTVAVRRLEKAAGDAPCVRSCRRSERRCLARCRGALKKQGVKGTCSCIPGKARCLIRAAEKGKCGTSGDHGRFIHKRPGRR